MTDITFTVENLDIIGSWDYPETSITDNKCNICKKHIMAPTYDSLLKGKCETKITLGKCKHCFHSNCITTTLKKTQTSLCPICLTPWFFEKEFDSNTFYHQQKNN